MNLHSDLQALQDFLRAALLDPARPHQLAISGSDETLTWQQLSVAVTEWLQRYKRCQPPAGTPVVLYGHQQAEFAVAIYSCLLHNIPYIPVDCIYPQERLKEICHLASAPYYYDVATRQFVPTGEVGQPLAEPDLAYIMFTSGSTGKPKGVQIGRESVWHFMQWVSQDFALPQVPVLMNHALFSFDLSLIPLLSNLATGGHIVLNAKEDIAAEDWLTRLKNNAVSVWVSTPLSPTRNCSRRSSIATFYRRLACLYLSARCSTKRWLNSCAAVFRTPKSSTPMVRPKRLSPPPWLKSPMR